jgi:hypothetical protein
VVSATATTVAVAAERPTPENKPVRANISNILSWQFGLTGLPWLTSGLVLGSPFGKHAERRNDASERR